MTSKIIPLSFVLCESRQFGKRKNFKKLNILGTKRAFQMNKNTFFVVFEGLSSGEKIKM